MPTSKTIPVVQRKKSVALELKLAGRLVLEIVAFPQYTSAARKELLGL